MGSVKNRSHVLIEKSDRKAQDLLDGIIVHQDDLGELGKTLENMMRLAGIQPSWEREKSQFIH